MTLLILMLAAAVFLFGGITGVLATLAIGIHNHDRAKNPVSAPPTHIAATRRILGVAPLDDPPGRKEQQRN